MAPYTAQDSLLSSGRVGQEAWAAKAAAWINSPEGRTRIEEGQRQAREVIAQLQEERRMTPELWAFRVTI